MSSTKINLFRNKIILISFYLLFGGLSVSKGLTTGCEFIIIALSIDKVLKFDYRSYFKKYRSAFYFVPYFLILIIGLLWTEQMHDGMKMIRHNHRWVVIPLLMLWNHEKIINHFKFLLLTMVSVAGLASIITILLNYTPLDFTLWVSENVPMIHAYPKSGGDAHFGLYSPFADRLQFSNMIGLAGITTTFLVVTKRFKPILLLNLLPIIFCSIILGGRGGQLSLLVGLIVYFAIILYRNSFPKLSKKMGKVASSVTLVCFFLFISLGVPFATFKSSESIQQRYRQLTWELETFYNGTYVNHEYVYFTSVRRIISWQHLAELFQENPILGVGTGDVKTELHKKYAQDKYVFPVNIHSQYLFWLAGWGIIGFLSFIIAWFFWLKSLFKFKNYEVAIFALVFSVFTLVSMGTDAIFIKQMDMMAFTVFMAVLVFGAQKKGLNIPTKTN